MSHLPYEVSKKLVYKGLVILGIVTLSEVLISLIGKGHLWDGVVEHRWLVILASVVIVTLSIYKAYYIIYNFMHMKYEVPGLAKTVLLPTVLLIWAMIAFFWEGSEWQKRRAFVQQKAQEDVKAPEQMQEGNLIRELEISDFH